MHNCINCDGACYCHGDIDDCQVETVEYAFEHCTGCGCEEEVDQYEPLDFEADAESASRSIDRENAQAINRKVER